MVAATVDISGGLVACLRADGAFAASVTIAKDKAYTAAVFGASTDDLSDALKDNPVLHHGIAIRPGVVLFGGGLPIVEDGAVIGAVGVSGGSEDDDRGAARDSASARRSGRHGGVKRDKYRYKEKYRQIEEMAIYDRRAAANAADTRGQTMTVQALKTASVSFDSARRDAAHFIDGAFTDGSTGKFWENRTPARQQRDRPRSRGRQGGDRRGGPRRESRALRPVGQDDGDASAPTFLPRSPTASSRGWKNSSPPSASTPASRRASPAISTSRAAPPTSRCSPTR